MQQVDELPYAGSARWVAKAAKASGQVDRMLSVGRRMPFENIVCRLAAFGVADGFQRQQCSDSKTVVEFQNAKVLFLNLRVFERFGHGLNGRRQYRQICRRQCDVAFSFPYPQNLDGVFFPNAAALESFFGRDN